MHHIGTVTSVDQAPGVPVTSGLLHGPWLEAFWLDLGFPLLSKSNFRRGQARSAGAGWKAGQQFERSVAFAARSVLPDTWELGPRDASVAQRPVIVVQIFAETLLDSGNLAKSVHDALEGVVFHNDASVAYSGSLSRRARSGQRSFVAVARLAPGATSEEIVAAQSALANELLTRFAG